MSIAFFDSGIGGITVLHEALKQLPQERFIYFSDTLHVPYGTKPKEQVKQFIIESVEVIMQEDVQALVLACNTATSIAVNDLREIYQIPIIGMEPAVKPAVEMNRANGRRVLVAATPLTLRESKYHELVNRVDDLSIVDSLPLPELVELCEGLQFHGDVVTEYFADRFSGLDFKDYGTLVLGCTHFPFYRKVLEKLLPPHISIIDGSEGTVKRLKDVLSYRNDDGLSSHGRGDSVRFLCSNRSEAYILKMENALQMYSGMCDG